MQKLLDKKFHFNNFSEQNTCFRRCLSIDIWKCFIFSPFIFFILEFAHFLYNFHVQSALLIDFWSSARDYVTAQLYCDDSSVFHSPPPEGAALRPLSFAWSFVSEKNNSIFSSNWSKFSFFTSPKSEKVSRVPKMGFRKSREIGF